MKDPRFEYLFGRVCACCGFRSATSVHEMTPGGNRWVAFELPECWLGLCQNDPATGAHGCHEILQGLPSSVSLSLQLAIKRAADPDRYDRLLVLGVAGKAETFVTEEEVAAWF